MKEILISVLIALGIIVISALIGGVLGVIIVLPMLVFGDTDLANKLTLWWVFLLCFGLVTFMVHKIRQD